MKQIVIGFVSAVIAALVGFGVYTACEDHKVVKTLSVLATEIGEAKGQKLTATDVVVALVDERIKQLQAAHAAEAPKQ